jgi:hypothetical protein
MTDIAHETESRPAMVTAPLRAALKAMRDGLEAYAAGRASRAVSNAQWQNADADVERWRRLLDDVERAQTVTGPLVAKAFATLGERHSALPSSAPAKRIAALLEAEAWTDAALALLALELPHWKLRRLVYDDGEWRCSLGKQWPLPEWLDDTVERGHPVLPLAIIAAMIEARVASPAGDDAPTRTVPSVGHPREAASLCCDNFA